jgi:hypothetical protein
VIAEAIHKACKGLGTNERAIIYIVAHRSRKELREVAKTYKTLYDKDIIEVLDSETSGWFRKALLFLLINNCFFFGFVLILWKSENNNEKKSEFLDHFLVISKGGEHLNNKLIETSRATEEDLELCRSRIWFWKTFGQMSLPQTTRDQARSFCCC